MIPEEIKNKIEQRASSQKINVSSEGMENIISDCEFGYSLAEPELQAKDKEIDELEKENRKLELQLVHSDKRIAELEARDGMIVVKSEDDEKDKEIASWVKEYEAMRLDNFRQDKEIERLKGLIFEMWMEEPANTSVEAMNKFKTDNNL